MDALDALDARLKGRQTPCEKSRQISDLSARFCLRCGRQRVGMEFECPDCGCGIYGPSVSGGIRPLEIGAEHRCLGPLRDLVSLPPGKIAVCHGSRGSGKSSVSLQALPELHVVSSEMAPALLVAYATRLGVRLVRISMVEVDDTVAPPVVSLGIAPEARNVLLDSLTASKAPQEVWAALKRWTQATGGRAFVVLHHTKDEQPAGMAQVLHDCDVEILVQRTDVGRRVELLKNRFGPTGSRLFSLEEETAPDRFYSVEGSPGRYHLAPYPSAGKYAAYWLWAEKRMEESAKDDGPSPPSLPAPPAAVAVQRTALVPGGWIEPADWRERRAFALAAGVPYFSPTKLPE